VLIAVVCSQRALENRLELIVWVWRRLATHDQ